MMEAGLVSDPPAAEGLVVILSGPSGCGKGTVVRYLKASKKLKFTAVISVTSREPRDGEIPGVHYTFVSREEFEGMIHRGEFAEWTEFAGNLYGTPIAAVNEARKTGDVVLLEVEVKGALNLRKLYPAAKLIFIQSPSRLANIRRLRGRGTTWRQVIRRTLESFREFMFAPFFDHREVNFTKGEEQVARTLEALILSGSFSVDSPELAA